MQKKKISKLVLFLTILSGIASITLTVFYVIYHNKITGIEFVELATKSILEAHALLELTGKIGWWCFGMWMVTVVLLVIFVVMLVVASAKKKKQANMQPQQMQPQQMQPQQVQPQQVQPEQIQ